MPTLICSRLNCFRDSGSRRLSHIWSFSLSIVMFSPIPRVLLHLIYPCRCCFLRDIYYVVLVFMHGSCHKIDVAFFPRVNKPVVHFAQLAQFPESLPFLMILVA